MAVARLLDELATLLSPPAPPSPFIGRASELLRLSRWTANQAGRRLIVTGPAGIGKTALVAEYVRRVREEDVSVLWWSKPAPESHHEQAESLRQALEDPPRDVLLAPVFQQWPTTWSDDVAVVWAV
jgi:ATP/maltotriose-dependent transcriptional regulator MalT